MRDVELAIRYLAFSDNEIEYTGNLKYFLDECSQSYNYNFDSDEFREQISTKLDNLNLAIEEGFAIFGGHNFSKKWSGTAFEFRFNRAIFDVMVGSLSQEALRKWASNNRPAVCGAFKSLCVNDKEFIRAIESTTKTPENTRKRFRSWYAVLHELSDIALEIPNIK